MTRKGSQVRVLYGPRCDVARHRRGARAAGTEPQSGPAENPRYDPSPMPGEVRATTETHLRAYLQVPWRRKWVIALVVTLVAVVAVGGSLLQTTRYTASAQIRIQPSSTPVPLAPNGLSDSTLTSTDVLTEQSLVTSN